MDAMLLLKASLLLSVTLLAARLLRRAPAAARHRLWSLAFAALLALPLLAFALPALYVPVPAGWQPPESVLASRPAFLREPASAGGVLVVKSHLATYETTGVETPAASRPTLPQTDPRCRALFRSRPPIAALPLTLAARRHDRGRVRAARPAPRAGWPASPATWTMRRGDAAGRRSAPVLIATPARLLVSDTATARPWPAASRATSSSCRPRPASGAPNAATSSSRTSSPICRTRPAPSLAARPPSLSTGSIPLPGSPRARRPWHASRRATKRSSPSARAGRSTPACCSSSPSRCSHRPGPSRPYPWFNARSWRTD